MARTAAATCKAHLERFTRELPEVAQRPGHEGSRHIGFTVRGKSFAYFTNDHHGDGRLALTVKVPPGEQRALVASEPDRFFVPPYLGYRGWVGMWLDGGPVDWSEAREFFIESYCLTAPKKLVALVSTPEP